MTPLCAWLFAELDRENGRDFVFMDLAAEILGKVV
jgi:hypothetical protein